MYTHKETRKRTNTRAWKRVEGGSRCRTHRRLAHDLPKEEGQKISLAETRWRVENSREGHADIVEGARNGFYFFLKGRKEGMHRVWDRTDAFVFVSWRERERERDGRMNLWIGVRLVKESNSTRGKLLSQFLPYMEGQDAISHDGC